MLTVELVCVRLFNLLNLAIFDPHVYLKFFVRLWRTGCVGAGILHWFSEWWNYRDKTIVLANILQSGIQDLKNHFESNLTTCLKEKPDFFRSFENVEKGASESDDSDINLSESESTSTSDSISSLVSETLSVDQALFPADDATLVTPRRNPPRASRPRAYHPPISRHDFQHLRLNPQLWFETSEDFTQAVVHKSSYYNDQDVQKLCWDSPKEKDVRVYIQGKKSSKILTRHSTYSLDLHCTESSHKVHDVKMVESFDTTRRPAVRRLLRRRGKPHESLTSPHVLIPEEHNESFT